MNGSNRIFEEVARDFGLSKSDLLSRGEKFRTRETSTKGRHAAMWLHRFVLRPQPSLHEIAAAMGGFDHSAIINGIYRVSYEINEGRDVGKMTLAIAIRLAESDGVRFAVPDVTAEVILNGGKRYQKRLFRAKLRKAGVSYG